MQSNLQWIDVNAAADFVGPGAIWLEEYQSEWADIIGRTTLMNQRMKQVRATGQPSRYFENLRLAGNAAFSDPQTLAYPGQVGPSRGENTVALKALVDSLNFGLFNTEVTKQQGQFSNLQGADMEGFLQNFMLTHDSALMIGTATNPQDLPSVQLQYCGIVTQILRPTADPNCAAGANVADFLRLHISRMAGMAPKVNVRPTGIELHPETLHKLETQERKQQRIVNTTDWKPGITVKMLPTILGDIPLFPNPYLPQATIGAANDAFEALIVTDNDLEYHWLTTPEPRVFQLGTVNDLAQKFVVVKFGAPIVKNAEDPFNAGQPGAHRKLRIAKA